MPANLISEFSLSSTGGGSFTLAGAQGKHLVIFFYPKDDTPGCTTEAVQFRDLYAQFQQANCEVVGISRDSLKSHENFKAKFTLPFELLSDADETVCEMFGVMKEKNMYGKQVRGIERSTFLIDASGRVAREWRGVKVAGHVEEVLEAARAL